MIDYLRSLLTGQPPPAPLPLPVTITGIRFPADGSKPHLLPLTTTTHTVKDGSDAPWGHIPDFRDFWLTPQGWLWRDFETFRIENQPQAMYNGLYVLYYSFDSESLPIHSNFPEGIFGRQRTFAGDAFIVKLQGSQIGEDLGEDGWAVWVNVPADILSLPVMKM
jgi:hypothetical protein